MPQALDFIQSQVVTAPYTSWLVGGVAEYFALPTTEDQLSKAWQWAQDQRMPVTILGGGSNVLVSDEGIPGLTLCLKNFRDLKTREESGRLHIEVLSGAGKSELLKAFLKHKLAPALFLAGIPGDVGGGVVMNAGVAESFVPREFCEIIDWFDVLKPDLKIQRYSHKDIRWEYRHSYNWQPGIITRVGISWPLEPDEAILQKVKDANRTRLSKQPLDMPSCGSVFINPDGHKAAQLIDSCGLKGFAVGGAQVSPKHANFIVNTGRATATELWQVIQHVSKTVLEKKNIQLKTEVVLLGVWP